MSNGHRWSKFWWKDWAGDAGLRRCSLAAQGLWMQLLCIMHEADRRGHLLVNGEVPTPQDLVEITGAKNLKELGTLLGELKRAGVYSHDHAGVIYCRRMVRDAAVSEAATRSGKLGGNPALTKKGNSVDHPNEGVNPPLNQTLKATVNPPLNGGLKPPLKLEADTDSEVEAEERKEGLVKTLTSKPQARAREAETGLVAPPRSAFDAELDAHGVPDRAPTDDGKRPISTMEIAYHTIVGKVGNRLTSTVQHAPCKRPKRSALEQQREVLYGPVELVEIVPLRPQEPVRTPAQQIAELLGISEAEAARRCPPQTIEGRLA